MTVNDQVNAWIRGQAGYVIVSSDAAPGGDQAPPKLPSANAGAGAKSPGVGAAKVDMNTFIRSTRNRSWTSHG